MAKKVNKETKKQLLKSVKVDIRKRMEDALADFKSELGEKKFKKRLRKASAIFSDGIVLHKDAELQQDLLSNIIDHLGQFGISGEMDQQLHLMSGRRATK